MQTESIPEGNERYLVVVNGEGQYSILHEDRGVPPGWAAIGVAGRKEECLAHIENAWDDMRPFGIRKDTA